MIALLRHVAAEEARAPATRSNSSTSGFSCFPTNPVCGHRSFSLSSLNILGSTKTEDPHAGDIMKGTGGARKRRFAGRGKGKSGGYRTVSYYDDVPVPLLALIDKGVDIARAERNALRDVLTTYTPTYRAIAAGGPPPKSYAGGRHDDQARPAPHPGRPRRHRHRARSTRPEAAVIRYFQEWMPYGLFVPEAGAATRGPGPFPNAAGASLFGSGKLRAPTGMRRARTLPSICPLRVDDPSASLAYGTPMPIKLPKPPPPLSGLAPTVVKLRLLRWCLAQNIHYG